MASGNEKDRDAVDSPFAPRGRRVFRVRGACQGIGFRPLTERLGREHGLVGWVRNEANGVRVAISGSVPDGAIHSFFRAIVDSYPLDGDLRMEEIEGPHRGTDAGSDTDTNIAGGFRILPSVAAGEDEIPLAPDLGICPDCAGELSAPGRRAGYPLNGCARCGLRWSIVAALPYDRRNTAYDGFPPCDDCREEYGDTSNRRYHAQLVNCPRCGPRYDAGVGDLAEHLMRGEVIAVKATGGFQFLADALSPDAVARARVLKRRPAQPFAVLFRDIETVVRYCRVSPQERSILESPRRPIVILDLRPEWIEAFDPVHPGLSRVGALLPVTALHLLVACACPNPLVCTSANLTGEPIPIRAEGLLSYYSADERRTFHLVDHDLPLRRHCDDSVVQVVAGRLQVVRRARGFVPQSLALPFHVPEPVFAAGGDLKNVFGVAVGDRLYLSPHMGDLKSRESHRRYRALVDDFARFLGLSPRIAVADAHPGYFSTELVAARWGGRAVVSYHHEAHVLSTALSPGPPPSSYLGVAFDGLGMGRDGSLWGGEIYRGEGLALTSCAHLEPLPLPGGDRAIIRPWRAAAMVLGLRGWPVDRLRRIGSLASVDERAVEQVLRLRPPFPTCRGAGRVFDAVAVLCGVGLGNRHEGELPARLEALALRALPAELPEEGGLRDAVEADLGRLAVWAGEGASNWRDDAEWCTLAVVERFAEIIESGASPDEAALRFHAALAGAVMGIAIRESEAGGLRTILASGGVLQNRLFVEILEALSRRHGFDLFLPEGVPVNDGGLALGQIGIWYRDHVLGNSGKDRQDLQGRGDGSCLR